MTTMISASAHAEKNNTAKARHAASKVAAGIVDPGLSASPMPATGAEDTFISGMRANNRGQLVKIEQREEIDRAEFAIDCRRSADFRADSEIRTQQSR